MTLAQARLQIAIRTAYEQMYLGGISPGLRMIIEEFKVVGPFSLKQEALGMLVHHFNFAPKAEGRNESTMLVVGVLFMTDSDLFARMADLNEEQKAIGFKAMLEAAIVSGERVKDRDATEVLFNYAMSTAFSNMSRWSDAFLVSDARKQMMEASIARIGVSGSSPVREMTGFEGKSNWPTIH